MDDKYFGRIIIAPYRGKIEVSEERNVVTIDGVKKLRGYAMTGGWCVESEEDGWRKSNPWYWYGVVYSALRKTAVEDVSVAMKEIYALCFLLRRADIKYAVLTPTLDGRYHFLDARDASVSSDLHTQCPRELVFEGYLPYPTTFYDGEVEVIGDAVPELLNYLYEKKYKEE